MLSPARLVRPGGTVARPEYWLRLKPWSLQALLVFFATHDRVLPRMVCLVLVARSKLSIGHDERVWPGADLREHLGAVLVAGLSGPRDQ